MKDAEEIELLALGEARLRDAENLQAAIMAVPESVFITDAQGYIEFVNPAFTRLTGYEAAEVIGLTPRILSSGLMPEGFIEDLWTTILAGRPWRGRLLNRRPGVRPERVTPDDEDLYWIESSIAPIRGAGGRIEGFVAIQREITAEVLNEEVQELERETVRLKAEAGRILQQQHPLEARFREVLELLVAVKGAHLQEKAVALLADPADGVLRPFVRVGAFRGPTCECEGVPDPRIAESAREEPVVAGLCRADRDSAFGCWEHGPHGHYVVPIMQADACLGVVSLYTEPGPVSSPVVLRMFEQITDLLGMALAEERIKDHLRSARRTADEAANLKAGFLASVSHELRTPLNGVLGMAQLLMQTELDPEQRQYAETLVRSGEVLRELIDDVLDFSKIEAGKLELALAPTDVRVLAEEVRDLLAAAAQRNEVTLSVELDPSLDGVVSCDPLRVRQVLMNLVGNAVKFTSRGRVTLRASLIEGRLRFTVVDTGIGIRRERLERIFQPFVQSPAEAGREFGGTGLGLTICRQLAELMGGEITVKSRVGEGSTFTFEFPVARVSAGRRAAGTPTLRRSEGELGLHVLLADDNAVNRTVAARMLTRLGCSYEEAPDGHEAVRLARSGAFDVVLMDVQMPNLDGLEATRRIRREQGPRLPIVALTAMALDGDRETFLAAGMDEYLAKPVRFEDLAALLERLHARR